MAILTFDAHQHLVSDLFAYALLFYHENPSIIYLNKIYNQQLCSNPHRSLSAPVPKSAHPLVINVRKAGLGAQGCLPGKFVSSLSVRSAVPVRVLTLIAVH